MIRLGKLVVNKLLLARYRTTFRLVAWVQKTLTACMAGRHSKHKGFKVIVGKVIIQFVGGFFNYFLKYYYKLCKLKFEMKVSECQYKITVQILQVWQQNNYQELQWYLDQFECGLIYIYTKLQLQYQNNIIHRQQHQTLELHKLYTAVCILQARAFSRCSLESLAKF